MILSARGKLLLEAARKNFELVREHGEKASPAERDFIFAEQIRSIRNVSPLAFAAFPTTEDPHG